MLRIIGSKKTCTTEKGLVIFMIIMLLMSLYLFSSIGSANIANRTGSKKLNVTTASNTQLQLLAGIGPATGAAVIEYRQQREGVAFCDIKDLQNVKGIGPAKSNAIADLICFTNENENNIRIEHKWQTGK